MNKVLGYIGYIRSINIDKQLFITLLLLSTFGILALYSSSAGNIDLVIRQAIHLVVSFIAMVAVAQVPPRILKKMAVYLMIVACLLLFAVHFFGVVRGGAKRWLNFGFMMFQPSELMKVILPITISAILSSELLPPRLLNVFYSLLIIMVVATLIIIQPDLGTSIITISSGLFTIFFSGFSLRLINNIYLNTLAIIGIIVAILFGVWNFLLEEYQKNRILTLFQPEHDPLGRDYHITQSKIAIGSGGLFGKGYGEGTQSQRDFLPEHTTDFIFATIAEELGFMGVITLLLLYFLVIYRAINIALKADGVFDKLATVSIIMVFASYVIINIGMVSGLLPIVGVPLPLVSYGGSSVFTIMLSFGVIMAAHNYKKPQYLG